MEKTYLELMQMIAYAIPIVFGLVEFAKHTFELSGKVVTLVSFVIGALFGLSAYAAYLFPAAAPHIAGATFILAVGLVASGFYKFVDDKFPKPPEG